MLGVGLEHPTAEDGRECLCEINRVFPVGIWGCRDGDIQKGVTGAVLVNAVVEKREQQYFKGKNTERNTVPEKFVLRV